MKAKLTKLLAFVIILAMLPTTVLATAPTGLTEQQWYSLPSAIQTEIIEILNSPGYEGTTIHIRENGTIAIPATGPRPGVAHGPISNTSFNGVEWVTVPTGRYSWGPDYVIPRSRIDRIIERDRQRLEYINTFLGTSFHDLEYAIEVSGIVGQTSEGLPIVSRMPDDIVIQAWLDSYTGLNEIETYILSHINEQRSENSLPPLTTNPSQTVLARFLAVHNDSNFNWMFRSSEEEEVQFSSSEIARLFGQPNIAWQIVGAGGMLSVETYLTTPSFDVSRYYTRNVDSVVIGAVMVEGLSLVAVGR